MGPTGSCRQAVTQKADGFQSPEQGGSVVLLPSAAVMNQVIHLLRPMRIIICMGDRASNS